jgi:diguanylate cyclase (GGDEF)-like protein
MKVRAFSLLLAALALPVSLPARAALPFGPSPSTVQPGPPGLPVDPDRWLPWRVFTWRDGVRPGNPGLAQDADGYIWTDGPIRYDGRTWQKIDVPGESGPVPSWSLLSAGDGSLWFGRMDGGLLRRLRNGTWRRYPAGSGLPAGLVGALVEDGQGTVWAGTTSGLARCGDGGCVEERALRGANIRALALTRTEDGRPALWIGTRDGLFRLDGLDSPSPILSPPFADLGALPDLSIRALAETESPGGRTLWIATDNGVARYRAGVWTRYDSRSGFPAGPVVTLKASRSPEGRPVVWAGSFRAGIIRFEEDGRWALFDTRSGLPANLVYNLLLTPGDPGGEPTLWAATPAGLVRLEREHWKAIDERAGLPNEVVVSAGEATFPDRLHTFWIGTVSGMVRLTSQGWERFAPPRETPIVALSVANTREEDGSESFWLGSVDGLHAFIHGSWTTFTPRTSPLPYAWIPALLAVPSATGTALWVATPRGLARYEHGRWTVFHGPSSAGSPGATPAVLPGNNVRALLATPLPGGGTAIWAGTDGGVGRFQGQSWETVAVPCLPDPTVLALRAEAAPDGGGWLWIGTRSGVARLRLDGAGRPLGGGAADACQTLTMKTVPALPQSFINRIQLDRWGRIYLFTDWGVSRVTLGPGRALATARLESFEAGDGLPGMSFNTAFVDHLGRVWGGAAGGVAILDPAPPEPAAAPRRAAPLRIERVLVEGRERPLADGTALRHDENSVGFHYALLSFRREHTTRYQTQLVGLETRPSPWTSEADVVYSRLPAGDYTFRVWGRDGGGTVAGPVEVRFRVRSAPWLTPWALALYALALIGLGYGASHVKTLARRAATLETEVAERTRELAEANRQLELASLTDPLTGLSNRRVLALNIEPDVRQAVRYALGTAAPRERNSDLLFYFLDIDHFKRLNDRSGHAAGDQVLVEVADRLREAARNTDTVVRWGGEEFLIVSRWADRRSGEVLAERLLAAIGGRPFAAGPGGPEGGLTVTCSIGWAPYPWRPDAPDAIHYEAVMSLADHALYLAKKEGRNRAVGALPGPAGALFPEGPLDEVAENAVELVRSAEPARGGLAPAGVSSSDL